MVKQTIIDMLRSISRVLVLSAARRNGCERAYIPNRVRMTNSMKIMDCVVEGTKEFIASIVTRLTKKSAEKTSVYHGSSLGMNQEMA